MALLRSEKQWIYDPNIQRWLNRDPIGEDGGLNFYCFINTRKDILEQDK
jgi:RHS repeat-associated protein